MKAIIHKISARDLIFNFSKLSSLKIDFPANLLETFKTECAKEGMDAEEVILRFVRDYLKDTRPYWDFSSTETNIENTQKKHKNL
jgi:hypothetical protein